MQNRRKKVDCQRPNAGRGKGKQKHAHSSTDAHIQQPTNCRHPEYGRPCDPPQSREQELCGHNQGPQILPETSHSGSHDPPRRFHHCKHKERRITGGVLIIVDAARAAHPAVGVRIVALVGVPALAEAQQQHGQAGNGQRAQSSSREDRQSATAKGEESMIVRECGSFDNLCV